VNLEEGQLTPDIENYQPEIQLTEQLVAEVNAMIPAPKFLVVCGDLVHAFPSETKSRLTQDQTFMRAFSKLRPDVPLICVCGNHDVGNQPTPEDIQVYTKQYGDDYFDFWVAGVQFLVLNSQFFKDGSRAGDLPSQQLDWLERRLSASNELSIKAKHKVIFQHIPWFLKDIDEPDQYFNVETKLRQKMCSYLARAGVSKIFCGHYHRNAGGWYSPKTGAPSIEVVVTSAVGAQLSQKQSHGYRIVHVSQNEILHEYRELTTFKRYQFELPLI